MQGYRPGGLAAKGFSPEALAEMRPGIVVVTLSAYGHEGPWASRRGFDSLVQNASGINVAEAEAAGVAAPKELPAQALDHATGYLMAFGAMMALARKAQEGGSWHVRVSLAQTGHWLTQLGRVAGWLRLRRAEGRGTEGDLLDEDGNALRPPHLRQARRGAVRDARLLGPPAGEARHACAGVAGVR